MKTVLVMMAMAIGLLVATAGTASADCNTYGCYPPGGGCNVYGCYGEYGGCNVYGCWSNGGGCNVYGCWNASQGACNVYGCSDYGECTVYGCPVPPPRRHHRGRRHASYTQEQPDAMLPELLESDRFFAAIERDDDC